MRTRNLLLALLLCFAIVFSFAGCNNSEPEESAVLEYPTKPINAIIAFAAGGGTDIMARAIVAEMELDGQAVVCINMGGAGTYTAADYVLNQDADGYHIFVSPMESIAMGVANGSYPFPEKYKDFIPLASVVSDKFALVVSEGSGFNSLEDVVNYAKANPGELGLVITGANSFSHIAGIKVAEALGLDMTMIPYTNGADIRTALMGNHEKIALIPLSDGAAAITSGQATPIAICAEERSSLFPDVPALVELGYSLDNFGYTIASHRSFFVKSDTPDEIVQYLKASLKDAMDKPNVKETLDAMYYEIEWIDGDDLAPMTDDMVGFLTEEFGKLTSGTK